VLRPLHTLDRFLVLGGLFFLDHLGQHDAHDRQFPIAENLDVLGQGKIAHVERLAEFELADVGDEFVGDGGGEAGELDLAQGVLDEATHHQAGRLTREVNRHRHVDAGVGIDLVEIGVQDRPTYGLTLQGLHQYCATRHGGIPLEIDQGVHARVTRLEAPLEDDGVEGEGHGILPLAIDDRRHASRSAQLARVGLAPAISNFDVD